MINTSLWDSLDLNDFHSDNDQSNGHELETQRIQSMDGFLASVERSAYVIAYGACHDQDNALDIVQDAMLSMVSSYSKKPTEQWRPLFFKVLNNRITDHHRKRGIKKLTQWFGNKNDNEDDSVEAIDLLESNEFGPDSLADSQSLGEAIEQTLDTLSQKQRQALILRLWQGLSVKETAAAMGISEGSVKTHLSRAVHEMREHLTSFKPS